MSPRAAGAVVAEEEAVVAEEAEEAEGAEGAVEQGA